MTEPAQDEEGRVVHDCGRHDCGGMIVGGMIVGGVLEAGAAAGAVCNSWRRRLLVLLDATFDAGRKKMLPYTVKLTGQVSAAAHGKSVSTLKCPWHTGVLGTQGTTALLSFKNDMWYVLSLAKGWTAAAQGAIHVCDGIEHF